MSASLSPHDLAALRADDSPVVLDVRTPAEFEDARLARSVNVPLAELKSQRSDLDAVARRSAEVATAPRPTVVVCQSGRRAREAADLLTVAGVADVSVLDGGLAAWRLEGREVETGRPTWEIERQVRLVAGSIVLVSVLASTVLPRAKWAAAGIGAGLTGAALTDTCALGSLLASAPWNARPPQQTSTVREAYDV